VINAACTIDVVDQVIWRLCDCHSGQLAQTQHCLHITRSHWPCHKHWLWFNNVNNSCLSTWIRIQVGIHCKVTQVWKCHTGVQVSHRCGSVTPVNEWAHQHS